MKKSKIFKIVLIVLFCIILIYCILIFILAETQKWEDMDGFFPWGIIGIALMILMIISVFPFTYYNNKERIKPFHTLITHDVKKGAFNEKVLRNLPYELKIMPKKTNYEILGTYFGQNCEGKVFLEIDYEGATVKFYYKDYVESSAILDGEIKGEYYRLNYYDDFRTLNIEAFYDALIKILKIKKPRQFSEKEKILLEQEYSLAFTNRNLIDQETLCGCFSCGSMFKGSKIENVIDKTVYCPYCQNLTVIMNVCDFNIDNKLLMDMHERYYRNTETFTRLHNIYTGLPKHKPDDDDINAAGEKLYLDISYL